MFLFELILAAQTDQGNRVDHEAVAKQVVETVLNAGSEVTLATLTYFLRRESVRVAGIDRGEWGASRRWTTYSPWINDDHVPDHAIRPRPDQPEPADDDPQTTTPPPELVVVRSVDSAPSADRLGRPRQGPGRRQFVPAYEQMLDDLYSPANGQPAKRLRHLTPADLLALANQRGLMGRGLLAEEKWLRDLANVVTTSGCRTPGDLPPGTLQAFYDRKHAA